jgi:hypothetical protein
MELDIIKMKEHKAKLDAQPQPSTEGQRAPKETLTPNQK